MSGKALMLQGTGSDVGKTTLVAGLCRIARRRGLKVAPFKPQNMSNNAAVTPDGGEIGRAQALQALACGLAPHTDFNPVLLKPQSDRSAQIIVQGQVSQTLMAADFMARRQALLPAVLESFTRLIQAYDLVLVEGAGSVAETNLRARDIANMGFARAAGVPVVLVGDIDRGGVIASLVGSQVVLEADDAAQIIGFLVNRFRGDPTLFDEGRAEIIRHTGWRDFGLMPWLPAAARLPAEDAVTVLSQTGSGRRQVKIVVPMLSRLANFDDLDPLRAEPAVEVRFVPPGQPLPLDADLILLAGTKSTRADLDFFRDQGWDIDLAAHVRRGGRVLGLCGGYQMLGRTVADPHGVDGSPGCSQGLGYLQVDTLMDPSKVMRVVQGRSLTPSGPVEAYEIHMGQTRGPDCARPLFDLGDRQDGAVDASGRVSGTYLHGLFSSDPFRRAWLEDLSTGAGSDLQHGRSVEAALDRLADLMESELDIDGLLQAARPAGWLP